MVMMQQKNDPELNESTPISNFNMYSPLLCKIMQDTISCKFYTKRTDQYNIDDTDWWVNDTVAPFNDIDIDIDIYLFI